MAAKNISSKTEAPIPAADAREFPKVVYHPKKGAKKVVDSIDQAAHEARGFTTTPPAPEVEEE